MESGPHHLAEVGTVVLGKAADEIGKEVFGKDARVFGEEAEEQAADKDVEVVQVVVAVVLVVGTNLVVQLGELFGSLHIGRVLRRIVYPLHIHERIKEAEVTVHLDHLLLVGILLTGIVRQ